MRFEAQLEKKNNKSMYIATGAMESKNSSIFHVIT